MKKMIVAIGKGGTIGYKGQMPWPFSKEDMRRFSSLTKGSNVVMGRKTWESLPKRVRPLPQRKNYVLTRNSGYRVQGGIKIMRLDQLPDDYWVIGGAEIYNLLDDVDEVHLSLFPSDVDGDTKIDIMKFIADKTLDSVTVCSDHIYQVWTR